MNLKTQNEDGRIRCVIYDCDGVLLDSLESNRRFYNYFRTTLGQPPLTEEELKFAHTHTAREALRFLFRNNPDLETKAQSLLSRVDPLETIAYLKLEPNVLPTLDALKGKGMIRSTENNPSCPSEPGPDGVNHRFAVNNTIILGEEDPVAMKKNVPDIIR